MSADRAVIPKRLGHIWIGPKIAPEHWMQTWPALHPDWEYTIYDNDFLAGYPFRLRDLINEYFWRGYYAGVQDMMRYEILYEFGGFMADADAICKHPIDALLVDHGKAYTVWDRFEGDPLRAVCPILACPPRHPILKLAIDELAKLRPSDLKKPEVSTGNRFLGRLLRNHDPEGKSVTIWPMHYFLPWHKSAPDQYYDGPDQVYAEQQYGTSLWAYARAEGHLSAQEQRAVLRERHDMMVTRLVGAKGRPQAPNPLCDQTALEAAQKGAELARAIETSDGFLKAATKLGAHLEGEVAKMTLGTPVRFNGMFYFRHMQNQSLDTARFKTRTAQLRAEILGWMSLAQNTMMIGYDTGHLPLALSHLAPEARLTAIDPCRWPLEKDKSPPLRKHYVPAACAYLSEIVPQGYRISTGQIETELPNLQGEVIDLLVVCDPDHHTLGELMRLWPHLGPDSLILIASERLNEAPSQAMRLQLQGLVYPPFYRFQSANDLANFCVMRPRLT